MPYPRFAALAAVLVVAACDTVDPKLAEKLYGRWTATGNPLKWIEFRPSGELTYLYDPTASPPADLVVFWRIGGRDTIILSLKARASGPECTVEVKEDTLVLHNGSGRSCMGGDPYNMEMEFKRGPS